MYNPLERDPLLRQAVKDLRRTVARSAAKHYDLLPNPVGPVQGARFVADRIWKDGKLIVQPYRDDA